MRILKSIFLCMSLLSLSACYEVEKGKVKGVVNSINKQGIFFKTYMCEVIKGGLEDGTGNLGRKIEFNIEKKELIEKLEQAMNNKKSITINYHQEFVAVPWRANPDYYFIDDIIEQ